MSFPSEETATATATATVVTEACDGICRCRERSHSDVARVHFEQPRTRRAPSYSSSSSSSDNNRATPPTDITNVATDGNGNGNGHDAILAPRNKTMGGSGSSSKKQHHHHHHHNAGGRPRSKSLDLHRHRHRHHPITQNQKWKYPNVHKHIPRTNSPITAGGGGCHALSPTGIRATSMSPSYYSPKLRGNMWIRRTSGTVPFIPVLATLAPTPRGHRVGDANANAFDGLATNSLSPSLTNDDAPIRQVTDGSGSETPSPTSFDDDDMIMFSSSQDHHDPSSSDLCRRKKGSTSTPARIVIFGESGKPIMPRSAFEHHHLSGGT